MAGLKRGKDLTDLVNLPRFGPAVLGQIERGERVLYEHEAEALAHVLPVEPEFFYEVPEAQPTETAPPALGEQVAQILTELQALRAREQDMQRLIDRQNANLAAQTRILERMQTALGITAPDADAPRPPVRIPGAPKPTVADPERSSGTRRRGGSQGA
jgi:hypothetical protein